MRDSMNTQIFEIQIHFKYATPKYVVNTCISTPTDFTTKPSSAAEKVWKLTYSRTSDTRLEIHCNGEEVLNLLINAQTCYAVASWNDYWKKTYDQIWFTGQDTASDQYRSAQGINR